MEFQNAVSHRDELIQQLTESLQQSLIHREDLQRQSEKFAADIIELKEKLSQTTDTVKNHKCHIEIENKEEVNSLSDVPSNIREFLEGKLKEVEDTYKKQIENYEVSLI